MPDCDQKTANSRSWRDHAFSTGSLVARTLLVIACVYYVVHGVDWSSVATLFLSFPAKFVALAFGVGLLQFFIQGWRLHLLTAGEVGVGSGISASFVCVGLNTLLPAKAGELAKIAIIKNASGLPLGDCLRAVFWERFLDLNVLSLMCVLLPLIAPVDSRLAFFALLVIALWAGVLIFIRWAPGIARRVERCRFPLVRRGLLACVSAFASLPSRKTVIYSSLVTLLMWVVMFLPDAVTIKLVAGLDLTLPQILVVFIVSVVGYSIPSAPGALGVFDAALMLGLGWFGVSKDAGLAVALFLRMAHSIPSLLFTCFYMIFVKVDLKTVRNTPQ